MGAKGKVTSSVTKGDGLLANRIEEAMKKNESLESLNVDSVRRDIVRCGIIQQQGTNSLVVKASNSRTSGRPTSDEKSSVKSTSNARRGRGTSNVKAAGRSTAANPRVLPAKLLSKHCHTPPKKSTGGKFGSTTSKSKGKPVKVVSSSRVAKKFVKKPKALPRRILQRLAWLGFEDEVLPQDIKR